MTTPYSRRSQGKRKTHRKSRNGCSQCKKRHIKCDEQRPICGDCQRLETSCSLSQQPSSPKEDSVSASSTPIDTVRAPRETPVVPTVLAFDERPASTLDIELLYNYLNHTTFSVNGINNPSLEYLGKHRYVEVAIQNPFVLNSLLAVSAIHLFSKHPTRPELYSRAIALRNVSLQLVRPIIADFHPEYAVPVFVFSAFTAIFTFAEHVLKSEPSKDAISDTINCFRTVRGIKVVIWPQFAELLQTWLRPALTVEEYVPDYNADHPEATPMRAAVLALTEQLPPDIAMPRHYAADRLFHYINISSKSTTTDPDAPFPLVQVWPVELEPSILEGMADHEPFCLVLLAYFAVLLATRPYTWWSRGWPEQLLNAVEFALAGRHADLLQWPREYIERSGTDVEPP